MLSRQVDQPWEVPTCCSVAGGQNGFQIGEVDEWPPVFSDVASLLCRIGKIERKETPGGFFFNLAQARVPSYLKHIPGVKKTSQVLDPLRKP